jgi:hypothetical protein
MTAIVVHDRVGCLDEWMSSCRLAFKAEDRRPWLPFLTPGDRVIAESQIQRLRFLEMGIAIKFEVKPAAVIFSPSHFVRVVIIVVSTANIRDLEEKLDRVLVSDFNAW